MRVGAWNGWSLCALIVVVFVVLCLSGCKSGSGGAEPAGEGTHATTKSDVGANTGELDADMNKDEVFAAIQETFGTDFSAYATDAYGVREGSRYYADLTVRDGAQEEFESAIVGLCGKGVEASSRKQPVLDNGLSKSFNNAELLTEYGFARQGANGAKTVTSTVYTAVVDGKSHVFVFGG